MTDDAPVTPMMQQAVFDAPTFFVDGNLGIATGAGVARITLAAYKLSVDPAATMPLLHPEVTIVVPEQSLLVFAHEIVERAQKLGIVAGEA